MSEVLLATSAELADGEPGGHLLLDALDDRGVEATWAVWNDPEVDWSASMVVARSTWDYAERREEFLAWAAGVPWLLNGAAFAWNTDKSYLCDLAEHVPVVPTLLVEGEDALPSAIAEFELAVVKPRVAAGGRGVVVFDFIDGGPADLDESRLSPGPWVVQPLVGTVRSEGEHSVFVLGGEVISSVRKWPSGIEIRVQEEYGGYSEPQPVTEELAELALRAVRAGERVLGAGLDYGRVDAMRLEDGTLVVSELEVTEPDLYLRILPGNAEVFADVLVDRLRRAR